LPVGIEVKDRSIYEDDGDHAVAGGLDQISFIDNITDGRLRTDTGGARNGD
jgi:hypothetical protein